MGSGPMPWSPCFCFCRGKLSRVTPFPEILRTAQMCQWDPCFSLWCLNSKGSWLGSVPGFHPGTANNSVSRPFLNMLHVIPVSVQDASISGECLITFPSWKQEDSQGWDWSWGGQHKNGYVKRERTGSLSGLGSHGDTGKSSKHTRKRTGWKPDLNAVLLTHTSYENLCKLMARQAAASHMSRDRIHAWILVPHGWASNLTSLTLTFLTCKYNISDLALWKGFMNFKWYLSNTCIEYIIS